jgi:hypothetical protein
MLGKTIVFSHSRVLNGKGEWGKRLRHDEGADPSWISSTSSVMLVMFTVTAWDLGVLGGVRL